VRMRLSVDSVEVATLKATGHEWDGPGGPRIPAIQLSAFFAQDLDTQLGQLVRSGSAPTPPDLFVRVFAGGELVIETAEQKGFDADWSSEDGPAAHAEIEVGAPLRIEVWDRDVMFHDLVGITDGKMPASAEGGRWVLGGFGQVRRLVLRLG
jgi:hypothetical protein